ncbi:hypothetical protein OROMI_019087 [Orobanche minor]
MINQKLQSDSRNRGTGHGLPSVSRFQSGHMPSGITTASRVKTYMSESDMDTCSDSEVEGRYSLEASPQDDKVPNGFLLNPRVGSTSGGGFSAARRGFIEEDVSSESASGSEASRKNGFVVEKKFRMGANFRGTYSQSESESVQRQEFRNATLQNNFDDGVPSAPPLGGSFQHENQVSEKLPTSRMDAKHSLSTAGCSSAEVNAEDSSARTGAGVSSNSVPARYPTFHASGLGHWYGVLSYDACVRLCLHSWARDERKEATTFLANECALLRDAFGLRNILLQSEEELLRKRTTELLGEGVSVKANKTIGKIKIQVRKVKMGFDPPTGCTFASLKSTSVVKLETFQHKLSNVKSIVSSERKALRRDCVTPVVAANGSLLHRTVAYIMVGTRRYLKDVPKLMKIGFNALQSSSKSCEDQVQESYSCLLRLKSSPEEDTVRMQPGSGETRVFLPDGLGDDLVIEVHDSKGRHCGQAVFQVADIADESGEKLRPCFIYREPEHEQIGKVQLYINYSTTLDENSHKCVSVAETIAYDCVLETAMKVEHFQQRKLKLNGDWKWLVAEFASYFGVSDAYTKLRYQIYATGLSGERILADLDGELQKLPQRYLSYVMDVATPTADCLDLVYELLHPVVIKGKVKHSLSHQEVRMLGEVSEQIEQIIALVFENYKSLDELSPSGMAGVFRPATGLAAPALVPALKLYKLLHDILSSEAQSKLCRYFQNATKKRSRQHLSETDEFVSSNTENISMDPVALSTAYKKMKSLCLNIENEILTDIEIHKQDLLPSFIDLPNFSSSIYSTELFSRLRAFLVSCPPPRPTPPIVELVIATADFQRDLALWNISPIKGGVDAKELFNAYITLWIRDKRLALLEFCKLDKVKPSSLPTQLSATSFIEDVYGRLKETLAEYDVIISRWPEYTFTLENAIADVEKAVVESLEKQYAEVLAPLRESTMTMKFGLKYVQKITKGHGGPYNVSAELGVLLNSMKRMLDTLRPQIEAQLKLWGSCIPESGNMVPGECLSEVTVMIRSKFRAYVQAVIEKLVENTKLHNATKLKKIIQDAKENVIESDFRQRMQPLKEMISSTIDQLYAVFETQVFLIVCRAFWDRMGQDVLKFLEDRKENRAWYKASRVAVSEFYGVSYGRHNTSQQHDVAQSTRWWARPTKLAKSHRATSCCGTVLLRPIGPGIISNFHTQVLDDTFASQMQQLLGNSLQEKDLEPPRCMMEVRSMLCKDAVNHKENNYYF